MEIKYNYPVQMLDDLIQKIEQGIQPMMDDNLEKEVNLRYEELQRKMMDDEDDDEFLSKVEHQNSVVEQINEEKRKAKKRREQVIELTPEELAEIKEDASASYVRNNPNSRYHVADSAIELSAEGAEIKRKVSSLGKVYYHQEDFRHAIEIITEAVKFSLEHDYPWKSPEEIVKDFRAGKIRVNIPNIPKLYIGYDKPITDPELLGQIITGDVTLVDQDTTKKPKKKKIDENTPMTYETASIISSGGYSRMTALGSSGYMSGVTPYISNSNTMYNRYAMPTQSLYQSNKPTDEMDWLDPETPMQIQRSMDGTTHTQLGDYIEMIQKANGNDLTPGAITSIRESFNAMRGIPDKPKFILSTSLEEDKTAIEIEQNILNLIRGNNFSIG